MKSFKTLQTHVEERRDGDLWRVNQNNVVQFLRHVCQMEQLFSEEDIHAICGAMDINSFEVKSGASTPVVGNCRARDSVATDDDVDAQTRRLCQGFSRRRP